MLRLLALTLILSPATARAHELRLERQGPELVLRFGHAGESHDLAADRVQNVRCLEEGAAAPRELRSSATVSARELRVAARCQAASAAFDGGFWSLTPDGEKNLPRTQVPDAVKSWASRQFAKWIDPGAAGARAPLGDALEILPGEDLPGARRGDKVTIRVLLDGRPASGAIVTVAHRTIGETDSRGEVRLRIRSRDVETIGATLRRPIASAEAEVQVLEATLTFEVAP